MRFHIGCYALPVLLGATIAYGNSSQDAAQPRSAGMSVEQKLQQRADIEFGDSETTTIGDVLDRISDRHGLRVQLDRSTALLMSFCLDLGQNQASDIPVERHGGVASSGQAIHQPGFVMRKNVPYYPAAPATAPAPAGLHKPASSTSGYVTGTSAQYAPAGNSSGTSAELSPTSHATPQDSSQRTATSGVSMSETTVDSVPDTPQVPAPPTPEPVTLQADTSASRETQPSEDAADEEPAPPMLARSQQQFRNFRVYVTPLRGDDLTVEGLLRAVIAQILCLLDSEEYATLPVSYTHAYSWDLLIKENGVYVTTRARANLHKFARVYRVPASSDFTPEQLAEVVRRTIRPWSWRDQIADVVNRIKIDIPPGATQPSITQLPALATINLNGRPIVQAASEATTAKPQENSEETTTRTEVSWQSVKALGSLLSSGTIATAHALINSLEMMHYADPPTATIEVLPGMLIISHSYAAHREIADLLEQIEAVTDENRNASK